MASEPSSDSGSLRVTLKDVYQGVNDIREQMGELKGGLALIAGEQREAAKDINDHEQRIRALEAWRYALPASAILGLLGSVGSLVALINAVAK